MPMNRAHYPDNWEQISHRIRFTRAQGKCECEGECGSHAGMCTAIHGAPHPVTGSMVVLTTTNLDHDTTYNEPDNLKAYCQKCHLAYDAEYHARNAAVARRQKLVDAGQLELFYIAGGER